MTARWPVTARIGLALILIAVTTLAGWACWDATRIWEPLRQPVSLAQGHIRTPPFRINLDSNYEIEIEVDRGFDFWAVPCLLGGALCHDNPGVLAVDWTLSSAGRAVANGNSNSSSGAVELPASLGRVVGEFDAVKGTYVLDLDVLQDASRLNGGAPRLVVRESGFGRWANDLEGSTSFLAWLLIAVAMYPVVRAVRSRRRENLAAFARRYSLTQPGPQPRNLQVNREPPVSAAAKRFRPTPSATVGVVLLLAGLTGYWSIEHWIATRILVALDMPVSLSAGHLRTGPFRINVAGYYTISVVTDHAASTAPDTRWILYKNGRVVDGSDAALGFEGETGVYSLDVEVLNSSSSPDAAHPRLKVATSTDSYTARTSLLLWLCTISIGVGAILLIIGCTPLQAAGGIPSRERRPSRAQPFSGTGYVGLITAMVYLMILIPIWVIQAWAYTTPHGLRIHLLRPGVLGQTYPGIQPLLVRVESRAGSRPPSLSLNSQPVSWEDFAETLQTELDRRPPDWPVYLDADPDLEWRWPAKAIDEIRGQQAEVVLLTKRP